MEQINIEDLLHNNLLMDMEEKNETWREKIDIPYKKGYKILKDFDERLSNTMYFDEENITKLTKNLSKDVNTFFDMIVNQISHFNNIEIRGILFQAPITVLKIYKFMSLYIKLCSILENKNRTDIAKTILMLFPCSLQNEYKKLTNKKPENIEIDGMKIRKQFELNNFKLSQEMIVPLSSYLFDVVYNHKLKEDEYTEAEEDIICFLAHIYLGILVYPNSTDRTPISNPYVNKLEEMLVTIFKNWKVTDDIDICWYHATILRKYNQRLVKETVKTYVKNNLNSKI